MRKNVTLSLRYCCWPCRGLSGLPMRKYKRPKWPCAMYLFWPLCFTLSKNSLRGLCVSSFPVPCLHDAGKNVRERRLCLRLSELVSEQSAVGMLHVQGASPSRAACAKILTIIASAPSEASCLQRYNGGLVSEASV